MNKSSMSQPSAATQQDDKIVDQAKQAVTHVASNVASQAREQVSSQFDSRKDKAVETIGNVASAIRDTSDKLKGVGPLGDVAGRAADGIESVAEFFEGKQIGDVVRDVERFARREPALFLGAAFALGLIGGSFLKSSAPRRNSGGGAASYAHDGSYDSYDRYPASYGGSYGASSYDDDYLSDDDIQDDIESMRGGGWDSQQQRPGRTTLPMGSRPMGARTSGTDGSSSYGATQGSYGASATQGSYGSGGASGATSQASGGTTQGSTTPSASPSTSTSSSSSDGTKNGVGSNGAMKSSMRGPRSAMQPSEG